MEQNTAAHGAHGTPAGTGNKVARIEEATKEMKASLLRDLVTLSNKQIELTKTCNQAAFELYGVKKAKTRKTYEAPLWLWASFLMVAGADIPLNLKGFEVLRMNTMLTWLCTISVALGLAFLSKYAGKFIKRAEVEGRFMAGLFGLLFFAGGIVVIWQVAGLRYRYLVAMHKAAWDVNGQIGLAGAVFLIAVGISWYFTSDAKNIKKEETYLADLDDLRDIETKINKINKELKNLAENKNKKIDKVEKADKKDHDNEVKQQQKLQNKSESEKKKEEEKNAKEEAEKVQHENALTEIQNQKSPQQTEFEQALGDFNSLLNTAQAKYERHEHDGGDHLRDVMTEDLAQLETQFEDLEIKAAMWSAGSTEFQQAETTFQTLKTNVSEKA